jgi:glycerol transport system ATP-binding protein
MTLRFDSVTKLSGPDTHLHSIDLSLAAGSVNVLLGATLAGKTSLLRIAAGLDRPTSGRVLVDDVDVTGVTVRQRNLAMVYQQFINYPSLTVFENIASPMRLRKQPESEINRRVGQIAEVLRLEPFLDRLPSALSGGQQQRTALARALAKDAALLLLDEPLVNLDYKLREELRNELRSLFRDGRTTVVYATTEPQEALQLGGHTAVLAEGRLLQFGPTLSVYRQPVSIAAARAFSDPPLNVVPGNMLSLPLGLSAHQIGVRAHHLALARRHDRDLGLQGRVEIAEISGSATYLHVSCSNLSLVAHLNGVHPFEIGAAVTLYVDPRNVYGFDAAGGVSFLPEAA